jgi:tetratricopeptide (TPR) repeat protein
MTPCDHLPHYLDGRLERAGREYFETHLDACPDCRKLMNVWACTKNVLKNEARHRQKYLTPTDEEASRLVQRAVLEASSRGFFSVRVLVPLTACVSFALAFVLASQLNKAATPTTSSLPSPQFAAAGVSFDALSAAASPAIEYETKADGRTIGRLGNDRFGLAAMSKLRVLSTEGKTTLLRIERGVAAFSVSKRFGGRQFIVEASDYRVVVVGTKFTVDNGDSGIRVSVVEGVVKVLENAGREWRLSAGEVLSVLPDGTADRATADLAETQETARLLGEIEVDSVKTAVSEAGEEGETMLFEPSSKATASLGLKRRFATTELKPHNLHKSQSEETAKLDNAVSIQPAADATLPAQSPTEPLLPEKAAPGMDLWRQWVLQGRFGEAESALAGYLTEHPVDPEGYSLLADCQRKAGKYADAVETYKKLTVFASENQANRARFMAGVLMQENLKNHLGAAAIFDDYLSTGKGTPILRAKASVRLASSLIELGEFDRARQLLRRIADDYSGTSIGVEARDMLDKID